MNLPKKTVDKINDASAILREKLDDVMSAFENFIKSYEVEQVKVMAAISDYNDAVSNAESLREEIASDLQSVYDDKSERWQESDAGQNLSSMIDEWTGVEFEPMEYEWPDVPDPVMEHADTLEGLPTEC